MSAVSQLLTFGEERGTKQYPHRAYEDIYIKTYFGVGDDMFGQFYNSKVSFANRLLQLIVANAYQAVDQRATACSSGCWMWGRLKSHRFCIAQPIQRLLSRCPLSIGSAATQLWTDGLRHGGPNETESITSSANTMALPCRRKPF